MLMSISEGLSHNENLEALEREVMEGEEDLKNEELDETVMQLEYFEEVGEIIELTGSFRK